MCQSLIPIRSNIIRQYNAFVTRWVHFLAFVHGEVMGAVEGGGGDFAGGDVETAFLREPDGEVVDYAELGFYAKGTADGVGDEVHGVEV
jgi:hypothetical protein